MARMSGGQAVVETLLSEGVEVVFGIPGVHTLEIYDALYHRPQLRHYVTRHEQGAAFMADGYARASGKVGVVLAITGPGVTNVSTAVGQAYADGSPMLVISSEVDWRHRGKGNLHELRDQQGMMRAITKWSASAESAAQIPELIHEGLKRAVTGWAGPTHVQIPINILAAEDDIVLPEPFVVERQPAYFDDVAKAVRMIERSHRPFILAGWGVSSGDATAELMRLAEILKAPVLETPIGKGAIPADHPLSLGAVWQANGEPVPAVADADLCLAVGTRLTGMETRNWTLPMPGRLLHLVPEAEGVGLSYPTELGLVGDAKATLALLCEELEGSKRDDRTDVAAESRRLVAERLEERSPEIAALLRDLSQSLGRNDILCMDMTIPSYWASSYYAAHGGRTFLNPYNFMALGFGLPAGIGAKIARPQDRVVVICGDGGFLFTVQELATVAKYGLDICIVVFNNDSYGAIQRHQERRYDGRVLDAELTNPDLCALAGAFGIQAERVSGIGALGDALRVALQAGGARLIEVPSAGLQPPF